MADELNQVDDEQMFELLDRYVTALHAGNALLCARWLDEHPQWRGLATCLEALDRFADGTANRPSGSGTPGSPDADLAATVVGTGAASGTRPGDNAPSGEEFGKYVLLEEIGRGGMGVVYRARQRDLNRVVALKMILSSRMAAAEDVKRFYREARAAGGLRHPHIVGIHEVGQINGQHYFAMDFIEGASLAGSTRTGPLDPERAARCLAGVARA